MGDVELLASIPACGIPVAAQVDVLRRELEARRFGALPVEVVDLYSLTGIERDVALDAVVAGEPSPLVLVGGRLACAGSVDVDAVLGAVVTSSAGSAPGPV